MKTLAVVSAYAAYLIGYRRGWEAGKRVGVIVGMARTVGIYTRARAAGASRHRESRA